MQLTPAQKLTLKNWVIANNNGVFEQSAVNLLNAVAAPAFRVWNRLVPAGDVLNNLVYANYTPNDTPAQATEILGQTWENRAMSIQIKQIALQLLLQGRDTFDASRANLRAGLEDATTSLPSGNAGANRNGGWTAIQPILSRNATVAEKLFASGTGSVASPADLGTGADGKPCEGPITLQQVQDSETAS